MKDAKGHGSNPRGAHAEGVDQVGHTDLPNAPWYHGSAATFSEFELGHGGGASKNGVWLSQDPNTAEEYAGIMARYGGEPKVYEASVQGKMATQKQWDDLEKAIPGTRYSYERDQQVVQKLKDAGFAGTRFGNSVYVFDPKNIKVTNVRPAGKRS